ncbi:hypothetical protein GCM10023143_25080 [Compostibacter hankyongensis]|uniref:Uncharacterized protein n=1 Tax=Compostibacter hankyongensis TaxID=1007089 RepID=A0ABP8FZR0_9BACT
MMTDYIFGKIATNLTIHREYANTAPATFITYINKVEIENTNNPYGEGPINHINFILSPKNR